MANEQNTEKPVGCPLAEQAINSKPYLRRNWTIGELIAAIMLLGGLIGWSMQLQSQQAVQMALIEATKDFQLTMRSDSAVQYAEIIRRLEKLDAKIEARHSIK